MPSRSKQSDGKKSCHGRRDPKALEKGQQTLDMFMARNGKSLTPSLCPCCGMGFDLSLIRAHMRACANPGVKPATGDTDVEIIKEVRSPLALVAPTHRSVNSATPGSTPAGRRGRAGSSSTRGRGRAGPPLARGRGRPRSSPWRGRGRVGPSPAEGRCRAGPSPAGSSVRSGSPPAGSSVRSGSPPAGSSVRSGSPPAGSSVRSGSPPAGDSCWSPRILPGSVESLVSGDSADTVRAVGSPSTVRRHLFPPVAMLCETVFSGESSSQGATCPRTPQVDADHHNLDELMEHEFSREMSDTLVVASPQKNTTPYYLVNFRFILESVLSDPLHAGLLDVDDTDVIRCFNGLSEPAQMLYVRLFQRKHAWIRAERMQYPEVAEPAGLERLLHQLVDAGLLDSQRQLTSAAELAQQLPAAQLRQLCEQLRLSAAGRRDELLARLSDHCRCHRGLFGATSAAQVAAARARALLGTCVCVTSSARRVLLRVLSLFCLPQYEDDEDTCAQLLRLLLASLGRVVYPPAVVRRQTAVFGCRQHLLRYEEASQLESRLRASMADKQWQQAHQACLDAHGMWCRLQHDAHTLAFDEALPPFLRKFTAASIVTYVRTKSVEVLQRRKDHSGAVEVLRDLLSQTTYLADYRGLWWDRLALTLQQHLRRPAEALVAVMDGLADQQVRGGRRLALEQRAVRLKHRLPGPVVQPDSLPSVTVQARCLPNDVPGLKKVFLVASGDAGDESVCTVEEVALAHYSAAGYPEGLHGEAAPTTTLFALLFWDLLYEADVADSFRCQFQSMPLDLNSDAFYGRRGAAVDARLAQLSAGTLAEAAHRLTATWQQHHGCLSLATWDVFRDVEHAQSLLRCLGLQLVCAICRRLATLYRFTRSGFPDLVVWNPEAGTSRIVEVKGPGDRLSTKQQLWLDYLNRHGGCAEVCYVRATGARRPARGDRSCAVTSAPAAGSHTAATSETGSGGRGSRGGRSTSRRPRVKGSRPARPTDGQAGLSDDDFE